MKLRDLLESRKSPEVKIIDVKPYIADDDDDGFGGLRYFKDKLHKFNLDQYDAIIVNYGEDLNQAEHIKKFFADKRDGLTNIRPVKYPDKDTEEDVIAVAPKLKSRITGDGNNCLFFFSKIHPELWGKIALIDIYNYSPNH